MSFRVVIALVAMFLGSASGPHARAEADDCITIESFAGGSVGSFPDGWRVRKDSAKSVYTIFDEGAMRFLRASTDGLGIQAATQHEWDLDAYPILTWSWRPRVFPQGANEQSGKNDSALAVYLLVPYSRIRGPKAVKYIWSEQVPVGTRLESNLGLTQVKVLRTGANDAWIEERVNARDDYRTLFRTDETPTPAGIAVLTDGDDTGSKSEGDYANFRACRL